MSIEKTSIWRNAAWIGFAFLVATPTFACQTTAAHEPTTARSQWQQQSDEDRHSVQDQQDQEQEKRDREQEARDREQEKRDREQEARDREQERKDRLKLSTRTITKLPLRSSASSRRCRARRPMRRFIGRPTLKIAWASGIAR
jgi:hypothetical protein